MKTINLAVPEDFYFETIAFLASRIQKQKDKQKFEGSGEPNRKGKKPGKPQQKPVPSAGARPFREPKPPKVSQPWLRKNPTLENNKQLSLNRSSEQSRQKESSASDVPRNRTTTTQVINIDNRTAVNVNTTLDPPAGMLATVVNTLENGSIQKLERVIKNTTQSGLIKYPMVQE
eukprot:305868_1